MKPRLVSLILDATSGKTKQNKTNPPASAGDIRDMSSSPEMEGFLLLQYSCLKNPMDRGAWQATVHRVAESWMQLKRLSPHTQVS